MSVLAAALLAIASFVAGGLLARAHAAGALPIRRDATEGQRPDTDAPMARPPVRRRPGSEHARELEMRNRELEQFAYVVSHDLKSPLRGIASVATWLQEDYAEALDEAGRENLALLVDRARRMHRLIDGVLAYSGAGRVCGKPERVDTARLVREVVDGLVPEPSVQVVIEEPLTEVEYDESQLTQVFQNLIGNALRHLGHPEGTVTVSSREVDDAIEFAVSDTGIGIPPEHHERVFRMFQTLGKPGDSTGIGLAIVKKIVEVNGGVVRVESEPGKGATFRFTVPLRTRETNEDGV